MKLLLKWLAGLVVVGILVLAGRFVWQHLPGMTPAAPDIPLARAAVREIQEVVLATGEVSPAVVTEIRSENSGQIARITVRPGDKAKKGEVLLELDSSELESTIDETTIQIETTKLQSEKADRDRARWERLFDEKIAPEKELADARTAAALAKNELKLQEARVETLRRRLAKTVINASIDGVILEVNVEEGMVIVGANGASAGTILMKAADLGNLLVKTNINEVDVAKLTTGMKLKVDFESVAGASAEGTLDFISPAAAGREKEKDVRVFPLIVSLGGGDPRIRPGISANLTFPVKNEKGVSVEVATVFREKGEDFVFVRESGKFVRRPVEVGATDSKHVVITSGLKEGEEVALRRPPEKPVPGFKPSP